MTLKSRLFLLVLIALMLVSFQTTKAQTTQTSEADEAAIKTIVKQLEAGWNAGDSKAFAAPFATDADYVVVNGMKIKGREEIDKGHAGIFSTIYKGSHNAGTIQSVRFLRPDVAVAHVQWHLEFNAGSEPQKASAMNSLVLVKDSDKWSIVSFQNTPIQERR